MSVIVLALTTVVAVTVVSATLRRLIGVRTGTVRTGLVAFGLTFLFMPLSALFIEAGARPSGAQLVVVSVVTLALTLVVGLVVLTVCEILVPTGSIPGPVEMVRCVTGSRGPGGTSRSAASSCGTASAGSPAGVVGRRGSPAGSTRPGPSPVPLRMPARRT